MLDGTSTRFSHVKKDATPWRGEGLRDFFLYRDLGIERTVIGANRTGWADPASTVPFLDAYAALIPELR